MSPPLVSTVIPVYNGERFLDATLRSAVTQNYRPHEVIVVDDGSTDATPEIAKRFSEIHYIRQENAGPAAARNAGIDNAAGDLICYLDADDLMVPGRIARQASYLLERPRAGCVLGRQELLVEPGIEPPAWVRMPRLPAPGSDTAKPNQNPYFPPCTMLARSWVFDLVGPFDPTFRIGEDVDWLFRVWDHGIEIGVLDEVVLLRRLHDANLTHDAKSVTRSLARALRARIERKRKGALDPTSSARDALDAGPTAPGRGAPATPSTRPYRHGRRGAPGSGPARPER